MRDNETSGVATRKEPLPAKEGVGEGRAVSGGDLAAESGVTRPSAPSLGRDGEPVRTCILTRATGPRETLIRLALSPDGQVVPDVRARAPGRGAWIGVARSALETAVAKGKLRGALMRAFRTQAVEVPGDLPGRIEDALSRAALDRLGLEARAGTLVTGAARIEEAARAGRVHLLLHAADAGEDGRRKLDQAWRVGTGSEGSGRRGLVIPADRAILSLALGRENVVSIAVSDRGAAARVGHALERWRRYIGRDDERAPGDPVAGTSAVDRGKTEGTGE